MISNIERFDAIVVRALAELYGNFPVRKVLPANRFILSDDGQSIDGLSAQDEAQLWDVDHHNPYFAQKEFAFETLHWLVDAGYVLGTPEESAYIVDAVLTAKGLEVLRAVPDSLQGSLGERIQEAAKSGASDVVRALVGQVVGLGMGLVT
ncbi:hypothetical protein [Aeromonas caviae]|uniref:hypothetical protein n=1 Tax=Aeromonas caviae TaxID=648 RepID=UPI000FEB9D74|nr:hypothetical protein [Aeromonas caviae]RWT41912.1 hypothetical protein DN613_04590 [Aeromonas caviae]